MTGNTQRPPEAEEDYTTSEGLRALLERLHHEGPGAWKHDPVAAGLVGYAAEKYAALARKHGLDPWDAASAAFDVMRTRSAREADDPWAVITRAVQITCIAEERAQGLLCSTHQARRPHISAFHDAERISDRETPLLDYHPAFQTTDNPPVLADDAESDETGLAPCASARSAIEDTVALFTMLGWLPDTARSAIEHVCGALTKAGSRQSAYEALRRDKHALALLDLPAGSWSALLRVLLGYPNPAYHATSAGRGILLRLLIGENLRSLLHDDDLILAISMAAPARSGDRR